jgi:hypothetical protein
MTAEERRILRMEFMNIDLDLDNFAGGCMKSKQLPGLCAGFNNAGKVGKYHVRCRNYTVCEGQHLQYNP